MRIAHDIQQNLIPARAPAFAGFDIAGAYLPAQATSGDFYDYLPTSHDELGIMVWQDFMFACAMYPEEDPYPALIEAEARHQVSRLASHPSLVLWCGGNECTWAHDAWGNAPGDAVSLGRAGAHRHPVGHV